MIKNVIIPKTICLLLLGLGLCLGSPNLQADELLIHDGQKLAFLGDSITLFGWTRPGGYVRLVIAGLATEGVKIVPLPAGTSGNTSADMLARLDKSILSHQPDWMTLSCGVNDVWHLSGAHGFKGVVLEDFKKNVTSIVDQAQAKGIKVMILTPTGIGESGETPNNKILVGYIDFLKQLAQDKKCGLVDLYAAFRAVINAAPPTPPGAKPVNLLTLDGVHMNPTGNILMAKEILKAFGVPEADFPKIEQDWSSNPDTVGVLPPPKSATTAPSSSTNAPPPAISPHP